MARGLSSPLKGGACGPNTEDGEEVVMVDRAGEPIVTGGMGGGDGEAVAAVELRDQSGRVTQCVP